MIYLKIKGNEVVANAFVIDEPDLIITEQEWTDCGCYAYLESGEIKLGYPKPTDEQQKERRSIAYQEEVDPITAHISRLRDEEQTEEVIAKIEELKQERADKVEEIKERYPYYEKEDSSMEG